VDFSFIWSASLNRSVTMWRGFSVVVLSSG
jgi:hypothetical protein